MKKLEYSVLCGLILSILLTFCGVKVTRFDNDCSGIRDKILRLHILANSDSDEDQRLKLKVRDRLLEESKAIFKDGDKSDTVAVAARNLDKLRIAAEDELHKNGCDYDARVYLDNRYFDVRHYNNVTMPSGYYDALVVDIGEAKGKNWWCVMFPPLCIPCCTDENNVDTDETVLSSVLDEEETEIVTKEKYEVKFKLLEFWDDLKNVFS